MKHVTIRSGILIGVILSIYCIISGLMMTAETDMSLAENIGNTVMFLSIGLVLFFAVKKYRDGAMNGFISFGQVFKMSVLATLIASAIYSMTWTVYNNVCDTQFTEIILEMTINELQEEGASDDEISLVIDGFETFLPYYEMPPIMFLITLIEPLFPGIIASILLGLILRRKDGGQLMTD